MAHSSSVLYIKSTFLAGSLLCSVCLISFTKHKKAEPQLPYLSSVDAAVEDEMIKQEIYGCAVGVVKDGQIVHVKTYGYHDRLRTKPLTANSIFRWASVSKPLTAVAAFKAIESGKMKLDDKVTKYVPYWKTDGKKGDITIRNLLSQRSGIIHYVNKDNDKKETYYTDRYTANRNFDPKQTVSVFYDAPLHCDPDTKYYYSSFGYNLLGAAIEGATGIPYEKYVLDNIGTKANMTGLTPYPEDPGGYIKDCNGNLSNKDGITIQWRLPGGGWGSTIEDFSKFLQGLVNGTFLNNTSALWQPVANNSNYCFGSWLSKFNQEPYVFHGGDHDNVRTNLAFHPSSKFGVVLMVNGGKYVDRDRLTHKIEEVFGKDWGTSKLPVNECGDETKCGDNTIGIWRKTDKAEGTVIRRGYSSDEFNAEWKWLGEKGYYCADFSTYEKNGGQKWDGIFKKTTKQSAMIRNYSHNDFNAKWQELSSQGYRLIDIETYTEDGGLLSGSVRKWAGLFIKMEGGYYLHREMSQDALHDKWIEYGKQGFKLVDIERYGDKWAGVWIRGEDVAMVRNYETIAFRDKRRELNDNGWRLLDVDTYMDGSTRKWSGLWEKSTVAEHFIYGYDYCDWLETYHRDYISKGYELIDMETY
jgi:CubicO group peptidase (beta-lactamase class C family)